LRKKGGEAASKKGDRTSGAGTIAAYIHSNGSVGAMVELTSETDFVSNNEEFKKLAYEIAMQVAATKPEFLKKSDITEEARNVAASVFEKETEGKPAEMKAKILEGKLNAYFADKILLEQPFIKNQDVTIQGLLDAAIQKFGEKIEVSRFVRMSVLNR
jgi:elongation factor Ts